MKKQVVTTLGTITCSETNIKEKRNGGLRIKTNAIDLTFSADMVKAVLEVK